MGREDGTRKYVGIKLQQMWCNNQGDKPMDSVQWEGDERGVQRGDELCVDTE